MLSSQAVKLLAYLLFSPDARDELDVPHRQAALAAAVFSAAQQRRAHQRGAVLGEARRDAGRRAARRRRRGGEGARHGARRCPAGGRGAQHGASPRGEERHVLRIEAETLRRGGAVLGAVFAALAAAAALALLIHLLLHPLLGRARRAGGLELGLVEQLGRIEFDLRAQPAVDVRLELAFLAGDCHPGPTLGTDRRVLAARTKRERALRAHS